MKNLKMIAVAALLAASTTVSADWDMPFFGNNNSNNYNGTQNSAGNGSSDVAGSGNGEASGSFSFGMKASGKARGNGQGAGDGYYNGNNNYNGYNSYNGSNGYYNGYAPVTAPQATNVAPTK